MTREQVVARAKAILAEAYDEAAEMIMLYLGDHPSEQTQTLCKEIDPDNWSALEQRVRRAKIRKASAGAGVRPSRTLSQSSLRHARSAIKKATPEQLKEIVRDLPASQRAAVVKAAVPPPTQSTQRTGPTFIELLVRVSSALIELEAMLASWQNPTAIPPEFSAASFDDVVAKVNRIKTLFGDVEATRDDEDEFGQIVRNFRLVSDVG